MTSSSNNMTVGALIEALNGIDPATPFIVHVDKPWMYLAPTYVFLAHGYHDMGGGDIASHVVISAEVDPAYRTGNS